MSACPICKRKKCIWIELKKDPTRLTTEELNRVVDHNTDYIEMLFKGNQGSSYTEERLYTQLEPYTDELERRGQ